MPRQTRRVALIAPLTRMEAVVLDLVGPGYSYDQVALALGLTTRTVRMHCERAAVKIPGTIPCLPRIVFWWRGATIDYLFAYAHGRRLNPPADPPIAAECRRQRPATVRTSDQPPPGRGIVR